MKPNIVGGAIWVVAGFAVVIAGLVFNFPTTVLLVAGVVTAIGYFLLRPSRKVEFETISERQDWQGMEVECLSRPAKRIAGAINENDYPSSALREGASGRCVVEYTVGKDGRVADTSVSVSSGHLKLDEATVSLIRRRFRFDPALDELGQPRSERKVQTVKWVLPEQTAFKSGPIADSVAESKKVIGPSLTFSNSSSQAEQPSKTESDYDGESDEEPWIVLSTVTTQMEVFRMTEEVRAIMDVARLTGSQVELMTAALDGPSWIGGKWPPTVGRTTDGRWLYEPGGRVVVGNDLSDLPVWAEKHRDKILDYLQEKLDT